MNRNVIVLTVVVLVVTGMLIGGKYLSRTSRPQPGGADGGRLVQGASAPDFALKRVDGSVLHLSDFRGKAVLLNFWATWCPPCKVEIPWFIDLQKQYGPQGLQVIGVSMDDESPDKVAAFGREMSMNYPIVMGSDQLADQYGGVEGLPTTFYIGRDGKIVKKVAGLVSESEVEQGIRAALQQGTPAAATRSPQTARTAAKR